MKKVKYSGKAMRREVFFRAAAGSVVEGLERRTMLSPILLAYDATPGATDNTPGNLAADLVSAINTANTGGGTNTIKLDPGQTYDFTAANNFWYGPDALPAITSTITIAGYGATLERDGTSAQTTAGAFRFFFVSGGLSGLAAGNLELMDLTLQNGFAKGGDSGGGGGGLGAGGAIFNQGSLILDGVTLVGNAAQGGASTVQSNGGLGGGGMGQDGQSNGNGGGMGGTTPGASGGNGAAGSFNLGIGGGGGGFNASAAGQTGAGSSGLGSSTGDGGDGGTGSAYDATEGSGGAFGMGGAFGGDDGGGGGVGGGGGGGADDQGGGGGFGGGGGQDASGGFGGGAGNFKNGVSGVVPGFGGGAQSTHSGGAGGGAGLGGAVFSMYGSVLVVNSTITGNTAMGGASTYPTMFGGNGAYGGSGFGGAIFNLDGDVELTDATIVGNAVSGGVGDKGNGSADGGSLYDLAYGKTAAGASVNAIGSIVGSILANSTGSTSELVNNTAAGHASANASVTLDGYNIIRSQSNSGAGAISGIAAITSDPKVAPLGNNGGPTQTMALLVGSPALGKGGAVIGTTTNQRGVIRTSAPDIGAFEATTAYPTPLVAQNPLGSLIYDPSVSGSINAAGGVQDYTLDLAANQALTLVLIPGGVFTGSVSVLDPSSSVVATATGSGAGATTIIQSADIATAGTYTIAVSGASNSTGTFNLQAILNAVYVLPTSGTSLASELNINSAFTSLGTTPDALRAGAVGVLGSTSSAYFGITLNAGDTSSIAVKGSGGAASVDLYDGSGNLVALPGTGSGVDAIISNFVAPSTSKYYVKVSGASSLGYDLVVTRDADFDIHGSSLAGAQPLDGVDVALGSVPAGVADYYSFNVNAGDNLTITTTTPGGTTANGQQFPNDFDPTASLYDAAGNLVAEATGNASDGRNDIIDFTALTSGRYRVEITGNTGEYTASIQGATGGEDPFTVTATNPAANADLGTQVSSMTVTFSDSVLLSSLSDSDFTIDGNNATGFTVIDGTDVSFSFPTTTDAVHSVSISGVSDIHGVSLTPDNFSFKTDDVAPTVVSSSISEGAMLSTGALTEVVTFSKPIDPSSVVAANIALDGTVRGVSYTASSYSFDPTDTILTVNYSSLPTDAYKFTLIAGANDFTSLSGVPLANSFVVDFTIPPVPGTAQPVFSKLSNSTDLIHTASQTFTGKIAAGSQIPSGNVIVTLNGVQKSVAIKSNGTFSASFNTSKLAIGAYAVQYSYAGNSTFLTASAGSTLNITYGIKPLFKNVKYHAGTTIWLQMLLTDASGKSVNTTHTTVTTAGLALASSPGKLLPGPFVGRVFTPDSDGDFFGLYLNTTGFANGKYVLYFTISGDPVTHSVTFTVG